MKAFPPALVALLLLGPGCGAVGASAPPPNAGGARCVNPAAPHRAYVVVTHLDGHTVQRCVGYTGPQIAGDALMRKSGIETRAMQRSWGREMCQVDHEPSDETACMRSGSPRWVMYVWSRGWQPAQTGVADTILTDGEGLGWRYAASGPVPPPTPEMVSR